MIDNSQLTCVMASRRLGARRETVGAAGALAVLFVAFAGLSVAWGLAGIAAVLVWASVWPQTLPVAQTAPVAQPATSIVPPPGAASGYPLWERILAGIPDAAVMLDRDQFVLAANAAAGALLPVVVGRHISLISRAPDLLAGVERARASGAPQSFQIRATVPVKRLLLGLATPIATDSAGSGDGTRHPALVIVLRDQTAEQELAQLRADFVANASHELRTPLASLKGFVETLLGPARNDPAAIARFLPIMQTQADRMSRLIDDLLSLSRIEMREHVPPNDRVDLAGVADETVKALNHEANAQKITLTLARGAGETIVMGDRDELIQVVQNLIQNALKYGKPQGHVRVVVTPGVGTVTVAVTDDGIGIAPEHLPRLTERFYRVSAKDSRDRGGTGLGLAIVKHIVNRHRGDLRVVSRPGEGSTFSVILPQRDERR